MTQKPLKRALLSVSDKTGLADLARALHGAGVELISTGGTAKAIADAGCPVKDVAALTGFPEMMDGRVKTLHPAVHGGLLALRNNPDHAAAMAEHGIGGIDLLVVNLYPFEATVAGGADFETCIENIDIGGPAMIRAGAKNWQHCAVVTEPEDYALVLAALPGGLDDAARKGLAAKAYARTARYDAAISGWYAEALDDEAPATRAFAGTLRQTLRYGENPHQRAAFYVTGDARSRPGPRWPMPMPAPMIATGSAPLAGLSPAIARWMARQPSRSRRFSPKSSLRLKLTTKPAPSLPPRRTCACWWPGACPIRWSARRHRRWSLGAFWCRIATMAGWPRLTCGS